MKLLLTSLLLLFTVGCGNFVHVQFVGKGADNAAYELSLIYECPEGWAMTSRTSNDNFIQVKRIRCEWIVNH